jgi:hypothetical protein
MEDALTNEIARVNKLTESMIGEYVAWGGKKRVGKVQFGAYDEILDFLNFRLESASSCLLLIENRRIADSLGLSRSLLENYLLFILMCRGRRLFKIQDSSSLSEAEFKAKLTAEQERIRDLRANGQTQCIEVRKAPRVNRRLMYVYEGFHSADEPDLTIPPHYFHFQDFSPEIMRLDGADYFRYFEPPSEAKKTDRALPR